MLLKLLLLILQLLQIPENKKIIGTIALMLLVK